MDLLWVRKGTGLGNAVIEYSGWWTGGVSHLVLSLPSPYYHHE